MSGFAKVNSFRFGLLAACVGVGDLGRQRCQTSFGYGFSQARHQILIVGEVVPGQQHRGDDLVRLHGVVEIGAAELAARGTGAFGIEPAGAVVAEAPVASPDGFGAGFEAGVTGAPSVAGGGAEPEAG